MSLINQMLKDLEKRRSRDLETSGSLNQNITWESEPDKDSYNWTLLFIVFTLSILLSVIGYLLWERTSQSTQLLELEEKKPVKTKITQARIKKNTVKKISRVKKHVATTRVAENNHKEDRDIEETIDVDEIDNSAPLKLEKKHRPLSSKQLAEIAYKKGYQLLLQGRMHQGKEYLHKALSIYIPHLKAREMLAGIYIKSARYIDAAELLREGVKVAPDYSLFAKLYARVLLEQKNPQLAIKILKQGAAFVTMNIEPDYYALLAATYQRVKKHENAVDLYLQLVKTRPAAGVWWLGLAISLEKVGKNQESLEAYQRAQKTGSLKAGLVKFTNNRVSALKEISFPEK